MGMNNTPFFVVIARHLFPLTKSACKGKYTGVCPFAGIFAERGIYALLSTNGCFNFGARL